MNDQELDELLAAEAEHAEQNRDAAATPGTLVTRPGRPRSTVYSVRLNPEEVAALQAYAVEADVPASTLVRSWIIERLGSAARPPDLRQIIHEEVREAVREALGREAF